MKENHFFRSDPPEQRNISSKSRTNRGLYVYRVNRKRINLHMDIGVIIDQGPGLCFVPILSQRSLCHDRKIQGRETS